MYCTISNCSAWLVTRDRRAEILLRQMPVGRVTWTSSGFRHAQIRPFVQPFLEYLCHVYVTAGQHQCDSWPQPISAPSGGSVTCDLPNNSKWYSILIIIYASKNNASQLWSRHQLTLVCQLLGCNSLMLIDKKINLVLMHLIVYSHGCRGCHCIWGSQTNWTNF